MKTATLLSAAVIALGLVAATAPVALADGVHIGIGGVGVNFHDGHYYHGRGYYHGGGWYHHRTRWHGGWRYR